MKQEWKWTKISNIYETHCLDCGYPITRHYKPKIDESFRCFGCGRIWKNFVLRNAAKEKLSEDTKKQSTKKIEIDKI